MVVASQTAMRHLSPADAFATHRAAVHVPQQHRSRNSHGHVHVRDKLSVTATFHDDLTIGQRTVPVVWRQGPHIAAGEDHEDVQGSGRWCASNFFWEF